MMRFLKAFLPNVSIALNICLLVIIYLDMRNPMMGFLVGTPFYTVAILSAICSISTGIVSYIAWRTAGKKTFDGKKVHNET